MPMQDETHHDGILEDAIHKYSCQDAFENSMSQAYISLFNNNVDNIIQIINTILASLEYGSVLFHCTAGKDRTGIIAALLLYLSKVDTVDISADYQITYTYNLKNPRLHKVMDLYGDLLKSDPNSIESLIDFFKMKK